MLISNEILLMYIAYNSELMLFRKHETYSVLYGNFMQNISAVRAKESTNFYFGGYLELQITPLDFNS